jgi:alkylated DNA repair dioxygenase AlkB
MAEVTTLVPNQYVLVNDFIERSVGERMFYILNERVEWTRQSIRMFGKSVPSPRLTAWYGDESAIYRYSGTRNIPLPWFDELHEIRESVEIFTRQIFNSVLLNLYRDGNDSMGRHSDDESELGPEPVIASVSLGAIRKFILHPVRDNEHSRIKVDLTHGSLLVMSGHSQAEWKHSVPRTSLTVPPRINLTFRRVYPLSH